MIEKRGKKKTNKNNKKATKDKKPVTLRLNDSNTVNANVIYAEESTHVFRIDDVDTNKIKVSEKKLYSKQYGSYKHYAFYEHNNKHITLNVFLLSET